MRGGALARAGRGNRMRPARDSPAPKASGCPTSAARSLAEQGRKRPSAGSRSESPVDEAP